MIAGVAFPVVHQITSRSIVLSLLGTARNKKVKRLLQRPSLKSTPPLSTSPRLKISQPSSPRPLISFPTSLNESGRSRHRLTLSVKFGRPGIGSTAEKFPETSVPLKEPPWLSSPHLRSRRCLSASPLLARTTLSLAIVSISEPLQTSPRSRNHR
jgi:hypothetical protein